LYSCDCELGPRLLHLLDVRSGNGHANDKRMVEILRIPNRRLRAFLDDSRSLYLVRDSQGTEESFEYLEYVAEYYTKSSATTSMFPN